VKIKQPSSDNALRSLWDIIDFARDRTTNCIHNNHDTTTVLYISSLIITPKVILNGRQFLREISNIISLSPAKCICLVRTTTPNYFRYPRMKTLQKNSVDFLRDKCYVVLYSPRREFLNHAKFLIYYHVCFSERIIYHGRFYGSTNLTKAGLGYPGNYEEFIKSSGPRVRLNRNDEYYLNEVLDLIVHKASLYTDPRYLSRYMSDHLASLETLLHQGRDLVSHPNVVLEKLYEIYVDTLIAYNQTIALLDEVPGRKITQSIINKLISTGLSPNPFEVEMMLIDTKYANLMIEDLELDRSVLQNLMKENISSLENAIGLIRKDYKPAIEEIKKYADEREASFTEFLERNHKMHVKSLDNIKMLIEERKWGS